MKRNELRGAIALTLALATATVCADAPTTLQPDDLLNIVAVRGVAAAKGGEAVAVTLTVPDTVADTRRTEFRVVSKSGGQMQSRVLPVAGPATWSKDGRRLLFVAGSDGKVEVCAYDRIADTVSTLARLAHAPTHLTWSPSETQAAMIVAVPVAPQPWFVMPPSPATAQQPILIRHPAYRTDNGTWVPEAEQRLYILDVASGRVRELQLPKETSLDETEAGDGGPPAWSRDERSVIVSVARGRDAKANLWNVNRDLLRIDIASNEHRWLVEQPQVENAPTVAPDGRSLAFMRQHGDPANVVFPYDLVVRDLATGRELMPLAGQDLHLESYRWFPDSRQLLVRHVQRGRRTLIKVTIAGAVQTLSTEIDSGSALAPVSLDGIISFVQSKQGAPGEAVTLTAAGQMTQWTNANPALGQRVLAEERDLDYPSAHVDRRSVHAVFAWPRGVADTSALPVVVDLHGGPFGASTFDFDADREFFVSQGYVVVQPNYRGSTGYGREFMQLSDRKHYPGRYDDPEAPSEMGLDVAGVLQAVRTQRLGDPDRVFLRGISAGALLTSWTIGRTDGFRAAVSQSWYPGEWNAPAYGSYQIRRYFNGPPWDTNFQPEYWRRQPLMLAERMVTPLLIIQGENDWITPLMEAEKFYYTIRNLGRDVQLAIWPDEDHGLRTHPASHRNSLLMEAGWFRSHDQH